MPVHRIAWFRSMDFRVYRFSRCGGQRFPTLFGMRPDDDARGSRTDFDPCEVGRVTRGSTLWGTAHAYSAMQQFDAPSRETQIGWACDCAFINSTTWSTAHRFRVPTKARALHNGLHHARGCWQRRQRSADKIDASDTNNAHWRQPAFHGTRYAALNALGPLASPMRAHSPRPPLARTLPPRLFCDEWPRQGCCAGHAQKYQAVSRTAAVMRH